VPNSTKSGASPDLRDVAQLDALAAGRGRRIALDRRFEPAVELAGRHTLRPDFAHLESGREQLVYAFAGEAGHGEQRDTASLAQPFLKRGADAVEQRTAAFRHVPFVDRDQERAAFLQHMIGDAQVLRLQPTRGVEQEDHHLREVDRAAGIATESFSSLSSTFAFLRMPAVSISRTGRPCHAQSIAIESR
jgi:hypothetical protein